MAAERTTDCPFCGRVERREFGPTCLPEVVSFEPLNPVTPGHTLFIPRPHVEHSHPGAHSWVGTAMAAAEDYAKTMRGAFNLITSSGSAATQTVPHVHVHYVPRSAGDGLALPWSAT